MSLFKDTAQKHYQLTDRDILILILVRLEQLEQSMSETQAELNELVTDINTAVTDLTAEIESIKSQPGADALDFSGLDTAVGNLTALDVSNTPNGPAPTPSAGAETSGSDIGTPAV